MHKKKPLSIFKLEHFQTQQLLSLCLKLQKLSTDLNLKTYCSSLQKSSVLPGPFICLSSCTSTYEPLTDRALSALLSKPTYPRCWALSLLLYSGGGRPHLRNLRHLWSTAVVNKSKERKTSAHHSPNLLSMLFKWQLPTLKTQWTFPDALKSKWWKAMVQSKISTWKKQTILTRQKFFGVKIHPGGAGRRFEGVLN